MSPPERYLIWSFEHRVWWGPGRVGYTTATHTGPASTLSKKPTRIFNEANRNSCVAIGHRLDLGWGQAGRRAFVP